MGNLNKYDIKTAERCCRRRVTGRASRPLSNQEEARKIADSRGQTQAISVPIDSRAPRYDVLSTGYQTYIKRAS